MDNILLSEQHLNLMSSMSDALIALDSDGRIVFWNEGAARLYGFQPAEALWRSARELLGAKGAPDPRFLASPGPDQFAWTGEIERKSKTGAAVFTLSRWRQAPVRDASQARWICQEIDITDLKSVFYRQMREATNKLLISTSVHQVIMDHSLDMIILYNAEGRVIEVNRACERILGYAPKEMIGKSLHQFTHPDDDEVTRVANESLQQGDPLFNFKNRLIHKDGRSVPMLWNASWEGRHERIIGCARDIGDLSRAAEQLERSEQMFHSLFHHTPEGILALDLSGRALSANTALRQILALSPEDEITGESFERFIAPESLPAVTAHIQAAAAGAIESFSGVGLRLNGSRFEFSTVAMPIVVGGEIVGVHCITRDITDENQREQRIAYLATHDSLTDLPNRNLLNDRVHHAIDQAGRSGSQVGILFLDLNRFKDINDSMGHDKGDLLLQQVALRLKETAREGDTVARLGGDEFVVVMESNPNPDGAALLAKKIIAAINKPVDLGGHTIRVSTSVGIALYPRDGEDQHELMRNADAAMYQAKEQNGGHFRFYSPDMNTKALDRVLSEASLRDAFEREELMLFYQPKICLKTRRIVGVEALARWQHPQKGLTLPGDFIPLAEETGLINEIGQWVIREACAQSQRWEQLCIAPIKMAVNLSARQLTNRDIIHTVKSALEESGMSPHQLEFEITETSLMSNIDTARGILEEIEALGVSFSIDDFGTGHSSLAYLKKLPISSLKIDRSFVQGLPSDEDDSAIVTATIAMAHSMGLRVIAEGVTSGEQADFLEERGCDEMQGFHLGRPIPAPEMEALLSVNAIVTPM